MYKNGFYTYTKRKRTSILRVDGFHCVWYASVTGKMPPTGEEGFIDHPYVIGLSLNGEVQWERNAGRRRNYHGNLSLDADGGVADQVAAAPDIEEKIIAREEENEEHERLYKALDKLTDRQEEIVRPYYWKKMTQEEIAKRLSASRPFLPP